MPRFSRIGRDPRFLGETINCFSCENSVFSSFLVLFTSLHTLVFIFTLPRQLRAAGRRLKSAAVPAGISRLFLAVICGSRTTQPPARGAASVSRFSRWTAGSRTATDSRSEADKQARALRAAVALPGSGCRGRSSGPVWTLCRTLNWSRALCVLLCRHALRGPLVRPGAQRHKCSEKPCNI